MMKMKYIAICLIAAILTASAAVPLKVKAGGTMFSTGVYDGDDINRYHKELGEMNVTVKTVNLTQTQSAQISKFDVEWKAGTVFIIPTKEKNIKIIQKGYLKQNAKEQLSYTIEKGTLKIRDGRDDIELFRARIGSGSIATSPNSSINFWISDQDEQQNTERNNVLKKFDEYRKKMLYDVIIQVPQKQYEELEFNSEYAYCSLKDIKINEADSDCTSGIVQYENCTLRDVSGETVNGTISLINCTATNVEMEAVNGDLRIKNSTVTDLDLDVINGDIIVNQKLPTKECKLRAVNGDINVAPKQFPTDFSPKFDASVVNGDIRITLPSNKGFYIPRDNVGNGDIKSDFKLTKTSKNYVYGDGKALLNVSCSNGDIAIKKAK